jgi:hypothetical protein
VLADGLALPAVAHDVDRGDLQVGGVGETVEPDTQLADGVDAGQSDLLAVGVIERMRNRRQPFCFFGSLI